MAITINYPTDKVVQDLNNLNLYNIDFGQLFQGRLKNRNKTDVIELTLSMPDPLNGVKGEVFEITINGVDDGSGNIINEERITVFSDKNYVRVGEDTKVLVSVVDYRIGSPYPSPSFKITFPFSGTTYQFNATWFNYWVIATPEISTNPIDETKDYQKWEIWAKIGGDGSVLPGELKTNIPQGETLKMEIMVDDPTQLPTPMRLLDEKGDYDALNPEAIVEGRRGVIVEFNSELAPLGPGSISSKVAQWFKKSDFVSKDGRAYLNFGEHSDKGVYTPYSPYLQLGNTGNPMKLAIKPVIIEETKNTITAEWRLLKEDPALDPLIWDGLITARCRVPGNTGNMTNHLVIFNKGGLRDTNTNEYYTPITKKTYTRNSSGGGSRFFTPSYDPDFNEENIRFVYHPEGFLDSMVPLEVTEEDILLEENIAGELLTIEVNKAPVYDEEIVSEHYIKATLSISNEFFNAGGEIALIGYQVHALTGGEYLQKPSTTVEVSRIFKEVDSRSGSTVSLFMNEFNMVSGLERNFYMRLRVLKAPEGYTGETDFFVNCAKLEGITPVSGNFYSTYTGDLLKELPEYDEVIRYETTDGIAILYSPETEKYYIDGVSTDVGSGGKVIGDLSGSGIPLPPDTISFNGRIQIEPSGIIRHHNGEAYRVFGFEEFEGVEQNLLVYKTPIGIVILMDEDSGKYYVGGESLVANTDSLIGSLGRATVPFPFPENNIVTSDGSVEVLSNGNVYFHDKVSGRSYNMEPLGESVVSKDDDNSLVFSGNGLTITYDQVEDRYYLSGTSKNSNNTLTQIGTMFRHYDAPQLSDILNASRDGSFVQIDTSGQVFYKGQSQIVFENILFV